MLDQYIIGQEDAKVALSVAVYNHYKRIYFGGGDDVDKHILSQVLNNYDQETTDFYRWRVEYTQEELSALILKRSGVDYGQIIDLIPVARGTSGRLWKLKIG